MSKTVVSDLIKIFKSGVSSVLPDNLIRNSLRFNAASQTLSILNDNYDVSKKNLYVVGTGKAVQNMARETEMILGPKIKEGIISIPVNSLQKYPSTRLQYLEGAKDNLPDFNAVSTATKITDLAHGLGDKDVLLVLISGGGSALLPLPKEPISLQEKTELIKSLANSGADIKELNIVRKKISKVKGGKLALAAAPAQVISLVLSDIVGDPLDLIASGPTVENKDNPGQAKEIVDKYLKIENLSTSIKDVLTEIEDPRPWPKNVKNYVIGSNKLSILGAVDEIKRLNYTPVVLSDTVTGNVKDIAAEYFKITLGFCDIFTKEKHDAKSFNDVAVPGFDFDSHINSFDSGGICLVFGGETTVEVKGKGKGGRNQHLALEFSKIMHVNKQLLESFEVHMLSAGTDGIDGPTDAAGAIGYKDLVSDAVKENIDVQKYLDNNDSYNFYKVFKNGSLHVITGHTGTNVMDLQVILIKKKSSTFRCRL